MAGFRDLLALLLGWKSAPPGPPRSYVAAAGRVWHTGAAAAGQFVAGQRSGQVHTSGKVAGQVHG